MPYNPLAYPYQLNTKELPANQSAAAAYLALPYASTSGPWGGPTVGTSTFAQSPYYTPNWGDETQAPGSAAAQAVSPVSTASVTRPDAVISARDLAANTALNNESARLTALQTATGNQITAIGGITSGAPTVMTVTPFSVPHNVATSITIQGSGFSASAPTVTVQGVACTAVTVVNDGRLTCTTAATLTGPVAPATSVPADVVVTTTKGSDTLTGGVNVT